MRWGGHPQHDCFAIMPNRQSGGSSAARTRNDARTGAGTHSDYGSNDELGQAADQAPLEAAGQQIPEPAERRNFRTSTSFSVSTNAFGAIALGDMTAVKALCYPSLSKEVYPDG